MRPAKEWGAKVRALSLYMGCPDDCEALAEAIQRDALLHAARIAAVAHVGQGTASLIASGIGAILRDLAEGKPLPPWLAARMAAEGRGAAKLRELRAKVAVLEAAVCDCGMATMTGGHHEPGCAVERDSLREGRALAMEDVEDAEGRGALAPKAIDPESVEPRWRHKCPTCGEVWVGVHECAEGRGAAKPGEGGA